MKALIQFLCDSCIEKLSGEVRSQLRNFISANNGDKEVEGMFSKYKLVGFKFLMQEPSGTFLKLTYGEEKFLEEAEASE